MNKNPRNYGFTLVEVLIALALVSLIGSGLFSVYWLGNKSYNQDSTDSDLQYMARNAMQRISSDIVQADTKQEDAIKKNLDGSLTIKKESGPVTYNQSSSNNWLYRSESGSTQAVAEMITNFEPIALGSNLWEITITAAQGSASYTLTSRISPRVALLEAGDDPDDPGNPDDPEDPDDPDDQQIGSKDYDDGYSGDDAIAENRFVLTSTAGGDLYITNDGGVTWQILDPPLALETVLGIHLFDVDISDIVSNGEKLVAVGEGLLAGRIATSDNGSNWEDTDIVLSSGGLNAVTWGQITANSGLFVAVGKNLLINNGNGGEFTHHADGENWTARTSLF
jgi:prepilin-type N-terminal cleavage/methylation domain-containing protein